MLDNQHNSNNNIIDLKSSIVLAKGGRRICWLHPSDKTKIIKTLGKRGEPNLRRQEAIWYKKLRPNSSFDDNIREYEEFKNLQKKSINRHFPVCYGIKETTEGSGIITDLITDYNGEISKTLDFYIKSNNLNHNIYKALAEFFIYIYANSIVTRDFLSHNLLVSKKDEDNFIIYMIDGIGNSELLPITNIKFLARKKISRKIKRFISRYKLEQLNEDYLLYKSIKNL